MVGVCARWCDWAIFSGKVHSCEGGGVYSFSVVHLLGVVYSLVFSSGGAGVCFINFFIYGDCICDEETIVV